MQMNVRSCNCNHGQLSFNDKKDCCLLQKYLGGHLQEIKLPSMQSYIVIVMFNGFCALEGLLFFNATFFQLINEENCFLCIEAKVSHGQTILCLCRGKVGGSSNGGIT